jgi:regulator of sigma E protease
LVVLSILVFAHELGHFWTARKFGIKAEEFGFGFPPRVWGVYKNKEGKWEQVRGNKEVVNPPSTIYSINWLPVGGFVKIKGEDGENAFDEDSLLSKAIWKKSIVMSAGVIMNILLAAVLISIGLMIGMPQALDDLSPKANVKSRQIQIMQVLSGTPAEKSNFKMSDIINSVDGIFFNSTSELQTYVNEHVGQELTYGINRAGSAMELKATPETRPDTGAGGIGISIVETGLVSYPWYMAIYEGFKTTFIMLWLIIVAFYELFKNLFLGNGLSADVAGPVGIATLSGQMARMGISYLIQFTAVLSINLAIINFLPFPALDGGRVLFLIIEKIKGSPVKREVEAVIHNIGFALLMLLVVVVTFRDVAKFGYIFKNLINKIIG